jgi:hypothetical protein
MGNASVRFIHKSFINLNDKVEDFPYELLACVAEPISSTHYLVTFADDAGSWL